MSAYGAWWWLAQTLRSVNIDSTVFMFDVEYEFLAFDRKPLRSPVIARVGGRWVVVEEWGEATELEGVWFDFDLPAALAYWVHVVWEKTGGTTFDYSTGARHNLANSTLARLVEHSLSNAGDGGTE